MSKKVQQRGRTFLLLFIFERQREVESEMERHRHRRRGEGSMRGRERGGEGREAVVGRRGERHRCKRRPSR
jgi:hypothetical protein